MQAGVGGGGGVKMFRNVLRYTLGNWIYIN